MEMEMKRTENPPNHAALGIDSRSGQYVLTMSGERYVQANGVIRPGESVCITARPQVPFAPRWFWVQAEAAPSFLIHRLQIGNCSQLAAHGPIIAEAFATQLDMLPTVTAALEAGGVVKLDIGKRSDLLRGEFRLATLQTSMDFVLEVENIGTEPKRFLAMVIGQVPGWSY